MNQLILTNRTAALLLMAWLIVHHRERLRVAMRSIVTPNRFDPKANELLRAAGS